MTTPDIGHVRADLAALRGRVVRGEIDEETYQRLRSLVLADLSPKELNELGITATPQPVTPSGSMSELGTPTPVGPSGGVRGGLRTARASLSDLDLEPGSVLLGQWKLVRELGRGGFGAVFEAEELSLGERHAVKVLDPAMVAKEELLARFRREVSLMRKLVHPRIVRVYDYREDLQQNLALISMELVAEGSVKQLLSEAKKRGEPIPLPLALNVLGQILEALEEAHGQGVIHRDVTPGNVLLAGGTAEELLSEPDRDPRVKLVDFGIAGLIERTELSAKSRVLGTAAYVAPEVLDPSVEVTPQADVYGAGAIGYELVTGHLPIGRFDEPIELRPELGKELNDWQLSLLSSRPEGRPGAAAGASRLHELRRAAGASRGREASFRMALDRALSSGKEGEVEGAIRALGLVLGSRAGVDKDLARAARWLSERRSSEPLVHSTTESRASQTEVAPRTPPPAKPISIERSTTRAARAGPQGESLRHSKTEGSFDSRAHRRAALLTLAAACVAFSAVGVAGWLESDAERKGRAANEAFAPGGRALLKAAPDVLTWKDDVSGLTWTAADNGQDITWDEAKQYCENLSLEERTDWRLPSLSELKGLRQRGGEPAPFSTSWPVRLTSASVWSGEVRSDDSSRAGNLFFSTGGTLWPLRENAFAHNALCVHD